MPTFEDEFRARIAAIEAEMSEVGETWTSVCRETGISRATPDRWKADMPHTIKLLDRVAAHVAAKRSALVAQAKQAQKS